MILGVGCDLVKIARIEKAMGNPRFAERIFTAEEREFFARSGTPGQFAAGRWAAKEAVAKALGTGLSLCPPDCVEVLPDALGKPNTVLSGAALERMKALGGSSVRVSITHEGEYAMAFAVLEGEA